MLRRTIVSAVVALAVAGCTQQTPAPESTVTVTATSTATVTATASPTPPGPEFDPDDPLSGLAVLRQAFLDADAVCRGGPSGDGTDRACDARDELGSALEHLAIDSALGAWRSADIQALQMLAPPGEQDRATDLLNYTAIGDPACAPSSDLNQWQCALAALSPDAEDAVALLTVVWSGHAQPTAIYVRIEIDLVE